MQVIPEIKQYITNLSGNLFTKEVNKLKEHEVPAANGKNIYICKTCMPQQIKITVHLPENVSENARRQKINRIYDILNPKISQ